MIVNQIQNKYNPVYSAKSNELGKEDFLRLLILQLQNQDPLEPLKNEEFIAQLAQFSALEQMQGLNRTMSSLSSLQTLTQSSSLIGKTIEASIDDEKIRGLVEAAQFNQGEVNLVINTGEDKYLIGMDEILSIW